MPTCHPTPATCNADFPAGPATARCHEPPASNRESTVHAAAASGCHRSNPAGPPLTNSKSTLPSIAWSTPDSPHAPEDRSPQGFPDGLLRMDRGRVEQRNLRMPLLHQRDDFRASLDDALRTPFPEVPHDPQIGLP